MQWVEFDQDGQCSLALVDLSFSPFLPLKPHNTMIKQYGSKRLKYEITSEKWLTSFRVKCTSSDDARYRIWPPRATGSSLSQESYFVMPWQSSPCIGRSLNDGRLPSSWCQCLGEIREATSRSEITRYEIPSSCYMHDHTQNHPETCRKDAAPWLHLMDSLANAQQVCSLSLSLSACHYPAHIPCSCCILHVSHPQKAATCKRNLLLQKRVKGPESYRSNLS